MKKLISLILCVLLCFTFIVSCENEEAPTSSSSEEEVKEYTVTFDSGGGSEVPAQIVKEGGTVVAPDPPTMKGHEFNGWYKDGFRWDFSLSTVTKDITLKARWTITYNGFYAHEWKITVTPATCTEPSKKLKRCVLHGEEEWDDVFSMQNPALGHLWVNEGEQGDGWVYSETERYRVCLREGCGHRESELLE